MSSQPALISPKRRAILEKLQSDLAIEDERRAGPKAPERLDTVENTTAFIPDASEGFDLGVISDERRAANRAKMEKLPPLFQFLAEMAPATMGTIVGGIFGGIPGAIGGGVAAEGMAQEAGISPRSDVGLAATALGPVAGRAIGGIANIGKKVVGTAARVLPPARVALARKAMKDAAVEMESIGTKIYSMQQGLMRVPTAELYKIVEKAGVRIPAFRTTSTRGAFAPLKEELARYKAIPEARQASKLLDDMEDIMKGSSVSFQDLMTIREVVGSAIRLASSKAGKRLGAEKQFFKALADDMDHLASLGGKTGNIGKMAKAAGQRAKLDFAVKDLERGAANYMEYLPGSKVTTFNVKNYRKWLNNSTNPKHKSYNKQMTESLEEFLPDIKDNLEAFSKFGTGSPGGVGSLIIRGKGAAAGSAIGGAVGGLFGGYIGAGIGGTIGTAVGAASPEIATAILSSPAAIKYLEKATRVGTGQIAWRHWEAAGQIAAQGVKVSDNNSRLGANAAP